MSIGRIGVGWLAAAWLVAGCLDPNQGGATGTVQDGGADITADGVADVDVSDAAVNQCLNMGCYDDNPCTHNNCSPSQGCFYTDKADGEPCGECGECQSGQCQEKVGRPGIGSGCSSEATPTCDGQGVVDIVTATQQPLGSFVKVRGAAQLSFDALCDLDICGDCGGDIAFKEFGRSVVLKPGFQTFEDTPWECRTSGCDSELTCGPLEGGTEYWAWGTTGAHAGVDPADTDVKLFVEGWCLATDAPTFAGRYEGFILHDLGYQWAVTLDVNVAADGSVALTIPPLECAQCAQGGTDTQIINDVTVDGGKLTFKALIPNSYGNDLVHVSLKVDQNRIAGRFEEDYGQVLPVPGDAGRPIPPLSSGRIQVQRIL